MPIYIQNRQRGVTIQTRTVKKRLQRMMVHLGCAEKELSIVFGSDRMLQTLNRSYRQKDRPTNVLAFPQAPAGAGESESSLLGDVIVSLAVAKQEAADLQQALEERVVYLLLHGLLHLLGYDHEAPLPRRRMEALEKKILEQCPA
ncbi:MAG: rRNA maturation RNase YbeY [Candidatus Tectimicrobiota bacterium]